MPFEVTCPNCDSELTMKRPPVPGKKVTCPDCEHRFVPDDESEEEPGNRKKRPRDDDDDDRDRRPRKKRKQEQSNAMLWVLLAGGGGLLLLLIAGGVVALVLILNKDKGSSSSSGSTASGTSKSSDSGWSPDPKYKEKLKTQVSVLVKYQMDIPQGYQAANFGAELISTDPHAPTLELSIDNQNPQGLEWLKKQPNYEVEKNADNMLKGFGHKNIQKNKAESGTLAGGTFYRIRFTATNTANKKISGFYYIGICDKDLIFAYSIGVGTGASFQEPATEDAVNTLEAALLTLRQAR